MQLPDFLTEGSLGEIRLTGHRIGLEHIVEGYHEGYSAQRLHEEYPSLPADLIARVLAFHEANRVEVDAYVARCMAEFERQQREGVHIDIEALKRRAREMGLKGLYD